MMIYLQVNYEETDRELARLSAKIRQVGNIEGIAHYHDDMTMMMTME